MPENYQTLLTKLAGFDTTSSKSNRACIDFIRDYLDSFKIKSEVLASENGTKACLWATIGPEQGKGIVLAGHSDTVPVEGQDGIQRSKRLNLPNATANFMRAVRAI